MITECGKKLTSFLCTELLCQLCLRLPLLCCTQEEMIRGIQQQIRVCVPDLDERVRQQEEALERASQEQTM